MGQMALRRLFLQPICVEGSQVSVRGTRRYDRLVRGTLPPPMSEKSYERRTQWRLT